MLRRLKKGQSTAEYAIVIGLVLAAVVAMQVYVKRGIQGQFKDASNAAVEGGAGYGVNKYTQFEPQYSVTLDAGGMRSERTAKEKVTTNQGGSVERARIGDETSSRTGKQQITY